MLCDLGHILKALEACTVRSLCPGFLIELLEVVNGYVLQIELKESTEWVFVNLGIFIISPVLYCHKAVECNENEDRICVHHHLLCR